MKETNVQIGDKVRSMDFEQIDNCYYEGIIVGFVNVEMCDRYKIHVTKRVFNGEEKCQREDFIYPPINGLESWMGGLTKGVTVI